MEEHVSENRSRPKPPAGSSDPWRGLPSGLAYGGDYNPEQWPRETWLEDVRLMREAGVNLVSLGIFSWVRVEPSPGRFDFTWLDEIIDLLHENWIAVDLATPTAGPPAWLYRAHPEAWVTDAAGVRLGPGSRGLMCPSSPAYREAAARITRALGERYAQHPAVVMFHVHNEYGAPVNECHCEKSQDAFRAWLLERHGDLAGLNDAWGTAFWGQTYTHIDEVRTPAATASVFNPAQRLDYARFCDAELRACYVQERDILKSFAPDTPVTTNFMATSCPGVDYWKWAREVDIVSNDHYLTAAREDAHVMLSMDADMTRSLAGGRPWVLMEHSTSAVNWQPRNTAKGPGELARNSLAHVARGADAVLFFQWRASRQGAEKFHSAMLPHGGTDTRVHREVRTLGADVRALAGVAGAQAAPEVAILWDWESNWAQDLDWRPSVDLDHRERTEAFYTRLWQDGVTTDFVHPEGDLSPYRLVIAPQTYLLTDQGAKNLDAFVRAGGHLLTSYFTGVVDDTDSIHAGGLSGPLGSTLGVFVEEFAPLRAEQEVRLAWEPDGAGFAGGFAGDVWSEHVRLGPGTEVLASFVDGPAAGGAAITRRPLEDGTSWYVATRLGQDVLAPLLESIYRAAGITRGPGGAGVEVVNRAAGDTSWMFVINHTNQDALVPASGHEVLTGVPVTDTLDVPAGAVRVVRTAPVEPST
jgi:beta-galactosidase